MIFKAKKEKTLSWIEICPWDGNRYEFIFRDLGEKIQVASVSNAKMLGYSYWKNSILSLLKEIEKDKENSKAIYKSYIQYIIEEEHGNCNPWTALAMCKAFQIINQMNNNSTKEIKKQMTYKEWMLEVNSILYDKIRLFANDIPNQTYKDNYEENVTPEEMVNIVIKKERYEELLIYNKLWE